VAVSHIGIVGTGRVALALGRSLFAVGEPIVAVASLTPARAEEAARFIGGGGSGVRAVRCAELAELATHVLIATSDDRIALAVETLAAAGFRDAVALHTAGARGLEPLAALRESRTSCGVFHPLHTIVEPGAAEFNGVTFGVAGDPAAATWASHLAARLGGSVLPVREDRMAAYHAAAVLASNALPALLDSAARLMAEAGVGYDAALEALGPLTRASAGNATRMGPAAALTGPIVRGDTATIDAHANALASAPADVAALYRAVSRSLIPLARRRGVPEATLQALAAALQRETSGDRP
jgi:predicted short-subunit dehydrogenase-like oxidoreductase (DUF2520 family)